ANTRACQQPIIRSPTNSRQIPAVQTKRRFGLRFDGNIGGRRKARRRVQQRSLGGGGAAHLLGRIFWRRDRFGPSRNDSAAGCYSRAVVAGVVAAGVLAAMPAVEPVAQASKQPAAAGIAAGAA